MTTDEIDKHLDISVVEVRGKKRVGFDGLEHLQLDEEVKEDLLQRYEEIILALDDLADEYPEGPDRAWEIGRILDEYNVSETNDITIADIARYNTIGLNERRMSFCRDVYRFFPDRDYDASHNVTALGDFASRAKGQGRKAEAQRGYRRLVDADEDLTRRDVFAWWELGSSDPSLEDIATEVVAQYEDPAKVVGSVKRLLLLTGQEPSAYSSEEIRTAVKQALEAKEDTINE